MVLVYAESPEGQFRKTTFEAVTYGAKTASTLNTECAALVLGNVSNPGQLGKYGATKVFQVSNKALECFDSQVFAALIERVAKDLEAKVVILSHSATGKSLTGRVAVKLNAGSVSGVNHVPTIEEGLFKVKKKVFSGKALAEFEIKSPIKVLSLMGNSFKPEITGQQSNVMELELELPKSNVRVIKINKQESDTLPLPEAELVVSAGRGMKGPENWRIIEELAEALGATTACSRPVADTGWRPHHEHVGQTGVAIRPNLYIAVGISGAIQHLAGVNSSKCIVVINKDPEAPFFKAADYGVCGDLFEVVPRLIQAIKKTKAI